MKFVFFGTADFAVPALRAIAPHVSLVVSQPDRPKGRGGRLQSSQVKLAALELGIPCETPEKCRSVEFIERIEAENADALIVAAYGQIMSERLLAAGRNGGINLHGSILPKYRGAAPIQRAIMDQEPETGVTLMQMAKGMDTGDMIDIVRTPIGPDETYGDLAERLSVLAAGQLTKWLDRLAEGNYPRTVQDDSLATHAAKIEKPDGVLDTTRHFRAEYARFRAVTPSPGATLPTTFGDLKIRAMRVSNQMVESGCWLNHSGLHVGFVGGSLEILSTAAPGKGPVSGVDLANGYRIISGSKVLNPLGSARA